MKAPFWEKEVESDEHIAKRRQRREPVMTLPPDQCRDQAPEADELIRKANSWIRACELTGNSESNSCEIVRDLLAEVTKLRALPLLRGPGREEVARVILRNRGEETWDDDRMWNVAEGKQALSDAIAILSLPAQQEAKLGADEIASLKAEVAEWKSRCIQADDVNRELRADIDELEALVMELA